MSLIKSRAFFRCESVFLAVLGISARVDSKPFGIKMGS